MEVDLADGDVAKFGKRSLSQTSHLLVASSLGKTPRWMDMEGSESTAECKLLLGCDVLVAEDHNATFCQEELEVLDILLFLKGKEKIEKESEDEKRKLAKGTGDVTRPGIRFTRFSIFN